MTHKGELHVNKYDKENKVLIQTGLSTGHMIEQLKFGDEAVYRSVDRNSDYQLVVKKLSSGAVVVAKDGDQTEYVGEELVLNSRIMSYNWTIYRKLVSFYDAMKAHNEQKKTITYHHDDELKYTFKHELETGQFDRLSNDSLCLYELIEGNWTIDN